MSLYTKKSGLQFSENNYTVFYQLIVAAIVNIDQDSR